MTPERFLADYPPAIQELAHELRAIVKDAVPGISERVYGGWQLIGYRTATPERPSRSGGAYFCFIAPAKDELRLGFEYGVLLADPEGLLTGEGKQVRYMTVLSKADLHRDGLNRLIAEAARVAVLSRNEKAALRLELDELDEGS